MDEQSKFEGWAVVEIMGHNREIGFVITEYFGGPALFRIDQPAFPEREYELERPQWVDDRYCPIGTKVRRVHSSKYLKPRFKAHKCALVKDVS
jgi:hypothetical protein